MPNVQEIFNRIQEKQKEQKTLRGIHRDVYTNSAALQQVLEEMKDLKEKKKKIENALKADLKSELDKMDEIKNYIASDREMLSNLALTQLIKGEAIQITDEHNNKYEPIFTVRFAKS
jgi:predicted transcriptional regulator